MARFVYQDGLRLQEGNFDVPASSRADIDSSYVFAFPKSGSVLVNNIINDIMNENGVPVIDLPTFFHAKGIVIDNVVFDYASTFQKSGYCYSGFRYIPLTLKKSLAALPGKKILLVRDPRDMLVSYYYSLKFSHTFPESGTSQFFTVVQEIQSAAAMKTVDEFCLKKAGLYNAVYENYEELLDAENVKVFRYEDIIFDKLNFGVQLCNWMSLSVSQDRLKEIVARFDIMPDQERPLEHIRQVTPGDHRRKLRPETIATLDAVLGDFIERFDYRQSSAVTIR